MKTDHQDTHSATYQTEGGKTKSNAIEVPAISLPKGGGAIKGIDEQFSVNAINGTAAFSIPLPVSPARGLTPALQLSYNSGAGNGIFGLGWNLGIGSIKRKTEQELPQYQDLVDSDTFLFFGADDLVPEFKKDSTGNFEQDTDGNYVIHERSSADNLFSIRQYKPRTEGLFARIERWTKKDQTEIKWRVIARDNITTLYGWSAASRISDPEEPGRIYEWLPEFVFDDKGNCTQYVYKPEDTSGFDPSLLHNRNRIKDGQLSYTNIYLDSLFYGNKTAYKQFGDTVPDASDYMFQTVLDYGTLGTQEPEDQINTWDFRPDAFSNYRAGFEIRTSRLCKRVLLFHVLDELALKPDQSDRKTLIRSLNFDYDTASEQDFTYLKSATMYGYIKKPDGTYAHKKMPAMAFDYQLPEWNSELRSIAAEDLIHTPAGLSKLQFTDLYNEGLNGILSEQAGAWYYKRNLGAGKFEPAQLVSPKPSFQGLNNELQLADLDADGGKQLVSYTAQGYFELNEEQEWQGMRYFRNLPNIDFKDKHTRLIDLNGDGRPELLLSEDSVFTWYASAGREGFGAAQKVLKSFDEEQGPHMVFSDEQQSIFLADMSGDGLTDIVRIRNGSVCYWPNLGYGRFGSKIALANAPVFDHPDQFNPAYIKLADIDGSGTTDIIYLGKNKFSCWKNLSGNQFLPEPFEIAAFPEIHTQTDISITDLLGNGLSCIVWSSPLAKDAAKPLQYIDLMNGKKPHIMIAYKNNRGKEVRLQYSSSTQFYIEDALAGRPWLTKLHFPVHCLSHVITEDKISGHQFIRSYKYHHGYYDHTEREFRGFGMVEQTDAESFEHWVKESATNITEASLHQEPVISRNWYHTGALLKGQKITEQFEQDYWYRVYEETFQTAARHPEIPLPDSRISFAEGISAASADRLSAVEWQQALRACKGMAIRSEIFAADAVKFGNTEAAQKRALTPYTVSTHNCVVEVLQPKGQNKHAVFIVKESEAISYSYERDPSDPRIAHSINLKLDPYGNVLEAASIVYPRKITDSSLPLVTQAAQANCLITYTQNSFTNDAISEHGNRLRLPSETKTYELKYVTQAGSDGLYAVDDFSDILDDSRSYTALYHETDKASVPGKAQKRLTEHIRSTYYKNSLDAALPLHQLESTAMPYESYQLAYTPELVSHIFGTKVNDLILNEGKFSHSEGDDNWWIRSGTTQYINGAETATDALNRFYSPVSYTDPYGAQTKVLYYSNYYLLLAGTENALGHKTLVERFNFRSLSAQRMKDINGNLSEVISDELGLVKALAVMGKGNEADELSGITEITSPTELNAIQDFLQSTNSDELSQNGKRLLGPASCRFIYDLDTYSRSGKPLVVAAISREQHFRKLADSPVQIVFEYTNSLGEVLMSKVQAEPGLAKSVVVNSDDSISITEADTGTALRWIGNGRTIKNNKGNIVKQYEPYFSANWHYEDIKELVETGVTPMMYYDAAGRLIKTEMPDGTFSKVDFNSWSSLIYDANDTVLQSEWYQKRTNPAHPDFINDQKEQEAAARAQLHADTPAQAHLDTLARKVLSIEHNRDISSGTDEWYKTILEIDIESNLRSLTDDRGNKVMQHQYDMLGNKVYQNSMDSGQRWLLNNILGLPLRNWDERGHEWQYFYDIARRPVYSKVRGGDGVQPLDHIFDRVVYGESLLNSSRSNEAVLQDKNILGQAIRHYDTAGLIDTPEYDFKGQARSNTRSLFKKYKETANWTDANLAADLEPGSFSFITETDALGRISKQTAPDGSVITPQYNKAGLLSGESILHPGTQTDAVYIKNISYNEKGQREQITYGNDVRSRFYYDKETLRLKRLESKKQSGELLQDLQYTFDPVGNITHIEDLVNPVTFFRNSAISALCTYTYDALYRLVAATGRENNTASGPGSTDNWNDQGFMQILQPADAMTLRNYTQRYQYDAVGNIIQMTHQADGNHNWTRNYNYQTNNNRLISTSMGSQTYLYPHHSAHGFIMGMPHLDSIGWNFKEELTQSIRQRRTDGGTAETTYYQYDAGGQRIRKITENQAAPGISPDIKEERIYLAGYELYKKHTGSNAGLTRTSISLIDKGHRFVTIETRNNIDDGTEQQLTRYQLYNHLGSATLETDAGAQIISYEEYHPFGTTAYQANNNLIKSAAKRYRYTGMERDEETGLSYHSARYYLPWLGRWLSADPIGIKDGVNIYRYARNHPIGNTDTNGKQVVESFQEGLDLLQRYANDETMNGIEYGLSRNNTTGELSVIPGDGYNGGTVVEPPGSTLLSHTHLIGDDAVPSNADLWYIARNQLENHHIFAADGERVTTALLNYEQNTGLIRQTNFSGNTITNVIYYDPAAPGVQRMGQTYMEPIPEETVLQARRAAIPEEPAPSPNPAPEAPVPEVAAAPEAAATGGRMARVRAAVSSGTARLRSAGGTALRVAGAGLAVLGSAASGYQIGTGLNEMAEGRTTEGGLNVAEGSANLSLLVAGASASTAPGATIVAETGVAAGGTALLAGGAAAGAIAWAFEDTRRALDGRRTLTDESVDFWRREGFVGGMRQFGQALGELFE